MSQGNLNAIRLRWWKEGRRDLDAVAMLGAIHHARSIGDDEAVADMEAYFAEHDEPGDDCEGMGV